MPHITYKELLDLAFLQVGWSCNLTTEEWEVEFEKEIEKLEDEYPFLD